MKRTRTSLLRRAVMWTAGVVLVVSVVGWVTSFFRVRWVAPRSRCGVVLGFGAVGYKPKVNPQVAGGWGSLGWAGWRQIWLPGPPDFSQHTWVLPLSIPTIGASLTFTGAWLITGHRRERRQRSGLCPTCAYDLTGITGPCPECGSETEHEP